VFIGLLLSSYHHTTNIKNMTTEMGTCVKCKTTVPRKELEENSTIGTYGFKRICDTCAQRIDNEIDSYRQEH